MSRTFSIYDIIDTKEAVDVVLIQFPKDKHKLSKNDIMDIEVEILKEMIGKGYRGTNHLKTLEYIRNLMMRYNVEEIYY